MCFVYLQHLNGEKLINTCVKKMFHSPLVETFFARSPSRSRWKVKVDGGKIIQVSRNLFESKTCLHSSLLCIHVSFKHAMLKLFNMIWFQSLINCIDPYNLWPQAVGSMFTFELKTILESLLTKGIRSAKQTRWFYVNLVLFKLL
jgi:hypothetical protein